MPKKLTIEDLLEKKEILKKKSITSHFSEMLGGEIEIEEHPLKKVSDIISKSDEGGIRSDLELIYAFCPIFRGKKLQEAHEVEDPIDVVEKVFNYNLPEIQNLAKTILKKYGFSEDKFEVLKKQ